MAASKIETIKVIREATRVNEGGQTTVLGLRESIRVYEALLEAGLIETPDFKAKSDKLIASKDALIEALTLAVKALARF